MKERISISITPDRLRKLEARRAALDLKIRASLAQERERRRRVDARGKIILGAALLALLHAQPIVAHALAPRLLPFVAERDRRLVAALFED